MEQPWCLYLVLCPKPQGNGRSLRLLCLPPAVRWMSPHKRGPGPCWTVKFLATMRVPCPPQPSSALAQRLQNGSREGSPASGQVAGDGEGGYHPFCQDRPRPQKAWATLRWRCRWTELVSMCGLPPQAMRTCRSPSRKCFLSTSGGPCGGLGPESLQSRLGPILCMLCSWRPRPELLSTTAYCDLAILKAPVGSGA